ncbi:MAG: RNA polymerase sigma factor [Ruminococcus sp.]|nr:RNA polymerase sigma factor [Ruminococcus sp.]
MDKLSRKRLVERAVSGDTEAFSKLYEGIYKQLYYYALANLRTVEDAADAVQDTVLDGFVGISSLRDSKAFDSWMFTILVARIKQKQKEYADRYGGANSTQPVEAVISDPSEFSYCEVLEEFQGLRDEERLCITLACIAGYKTAEITKITGINSSTVRSHILRGKKKLRKKLSE